MEAVKQEAAKQTIIDVPREVTKYYCYDCAVGFSSAQGFAAHCKKKHGRAHPRANVVFGTSCLCCLTEYWTRSRLLAHLTYSDACYENTLAAVGPAPPEVSEDLQRQETALKKKNNINKLDARSLPCIRLQGPVCLWATDASTVARQEVSEGGL